MRKYFYPAYFQQDTQSVFILNDFPSFYARYALKKSLHSHYFRASFHILRSHSASTNYLYDCDSSQGTLRMAVNTQIRAHPF
ncbi:hypothetical protein HMPREF1002_03250 [Porphyromonas sp. 31_2]|nr:hypothetical protein HMPREF1002_03250 [Porphyromonas sp. 31_2]